MKLRTFETMVPVWAEILCDILKDEIVIPKHTHLNTAHIITASNGEAATGMCKIFDRVIYISYYGSILDIKKTYPEYVELYKWLYPGKRPPKRKAFYRTHIIEVLIHELSHLSQYVPVKYRIYPVKNYSRMKYPMSLSDVHRDKAVKICEFSNSFRTLYILQKYKDQLEERLGVIPGGITAPHCYAEYLVQKCCMENNVTKLDPSNLKEVLKDLYTNKKIPFITLSQTHHYIPWKKASIEYLNACYEAYDEVETQSINDRYQDNYANYDSYFNYKRLYELYSDLRKKHIRDI